MLSIVALVGALAASVHCLPAAQHSEGSASSPSTTMCGNDQNIVLDGTPYLVANSMYAAQFFAPGDSACTTFNNLQGNSVVWSATTNIQDVPATNNICKGYINVGMIGDLGNSLSTISSIPASFSWTRTTSTPFKGNICFDFIVSPQQGDFTSGAANELMLWLEYEGGQLPIGWDKGAKATFNLFGTTWSLYEDTNPAGMMVHSMIPNSPFAGNFQFDLLPWFDAMVSHGVFTNDAFVNIGNAGSEVFYGNSQLQSTLQLQILTGGQRSAAPVPQGPPPVTNVSGGTVNGTAPARMRR